MTIQPINYIQYSNKINFHGLKQKELSFPKNYISPEDNGNQNNDSKKPLPEWARKGMLFTVVFFAFKNDPYVQNLFRSSEISQEQKDRTEFFESVQKMRKEKGKSASFYHLNKLFDIEHPKIKVIGKNSYSLDFNLDNQTITLKMHLDENNKDTINGSIKIGQKDYVKYKAIFSADNKDEFKVLLKDKENKKYIFGRDYYGEFYKINGNKKETLNNKNVEEHKQYLEMLDNLDDMKFFTNQNDMWRKLNILLIIYLLYQESKHDKMRRKNKQKNSMEV